ncbi:MAG: SpoIIE family protein phosphatase [bacterium]|nr:SpoIIE family protein phosphatase [bacterium]
MMEQMGPGDASADQPAARGDDARDVAELLSAVGLDELQRMQDTFAALGRVTLCICDPTGGLVTQPSCPSAFCGLMTESAGGLAACRESVSERARQVMRLETGLCHAGALHFSAPVRVDGRHVATVVLGERAGAGADHEAVVRLADEHGISPIELGRAARSADSPPGEREGVVTRFLHLFADRLAELCRRHRRMTQRVRELEAVHDLTAMFAGTEELPEILTATAERICGVVEVRSCSIRLHDPESGELRIVAGYNLSSAYLEKGSVLLGENPIDSAAFGGETVYIRNVPGDPGTRYPDQARAEGLVSGLCIPMAYQGKTIGVIRVYTDYECEFSSFQVALIRSIGSQVAAALQLFRLHQDQLSAERREFHLHEAAAIQRRMIPAAPRTHASISFGCVYNPSLDVGGDFYDFIELPEGHLGVCVADVVGKGVSAALMMASVRSALRAHAHSIYNLDEIVTLVNRHMSRDTLSSEFATLFYGVLSADGRRLTYCNAGHEPGLLFRTAEHGPMGSRVHELSTGGMVIGVDPDTEYSRGIVDLQPGDILVSYTDGVNEALDFDERMFGRERLRESVWRYAKLDAPTLAKQLLWDVRRFVGLARQTDDITIVVAKVE